MLCSRLSSPWFLGVVCLCLWQTICNFDVKIIYVPYIFSMHIYIECFINFLKKSQSNKLCILAKILNELTPIFYKLALLLYKICILVLMTKQMHMILVEQLYPSRHWHVIPLLKHNQLTDIISKPKKVYTSIITVEIHKNKPLQMFDIELCNLPCNLPYI